LARFLNRKNNSLAAVKNRANPSGTGQFLIPIIKHISAFRCMAYMAHNTHIGEANGWFVFPRRGQPVGLRP
jgi:hypothetical protein